MRVLRIFFLLGGAHLATWQESTESKHKTCWQIWGHSAWMICSMNFCEALMLGNNTCLQEFLNGLTTQLATCEGIRISSAPGTAHGFAELADAAALGTLAFGSGPAASAFFGRVSCELKTHGHAASG